ncbi:MAG: ribonuclease J [Polyangiaceae bacterium]
MSAPIPKDERGAAARVRLWPLGGLGEVGMNCMAFEQRGDVVVVDCGVTFDDRGLGVDVIHPSFESLEPLADRIRGLVLTHGHEDHIGAVAYFLRRFDVPVYGPKYALALLEEKAAEFEILEHATFVEVRPREPFEVGSFVVEPIRVTHSIADATALAIRTDAGTVIHTGDFKFDDSPPDGEEFDVARFTELGDEGVALLLSDSTNVDARGENASESTVGEALDRVVGNARGAVVCALFGSNVHRLRLVAETARRTGRRIALLGRGIETHFRVGHRTGYLDWPADLVLPTTRLDEVPRSTILALATGTQAEANAALARLARGDHPKFTLVEGDTVVLSSRVIPGRDPEVYAMMGNLLRRGVELRSWITDKDVHVSGHAYRSEQRRMLDLVRPTNFVPVHGTLHHLTRHAELAAEAGVATRLVLENGDVAELEGGRIAKVGTVPSGRVHVNVGRVLSPEVLRARLALAREGVVAATVVLDGRGYVLDAIVKGVGIFDVGMHDAHAADVRRTVLDAVGSTTWSGKDDDALMEASRRAIRRAVVRITGTKPETAVAVARVNS